jgi:hypothetical protein
VWTQQRPQVGEMKKRNTADVDLVVTRSFPIV